MAYFDNHEFDQPSTVMISESHEWFRAAPVESRVTPPKSKNKEKIVSVNLFQCRIISFVKHFALGSYNLFQRGTVHANIIVVCAIVDFQNHGIRLVE